MAFDAINSSLQSNDVERKDTVKKGNAIFAFALMNKEGDTECWHIDLKDKGVVAKGDAPKGKKADGRSLFPPSSTSEMVTMGIEGSLLALGLQRQARTFEQTG